jgi:hypothetical protein
MPRIRCHYLDCIFLDDGYCGAAAVEFDPDVGCMTYARGDDIADEDWEDEDEDLEDWDEIEVEEEDDELWLDDDDDF